MFFSPSHYIIFVYIFPYYKADTWAIKQIADSQLKNLIRTGRLQHKQDYRYRDTKYFFLFLIGYWVCSVGLVGRSFPALIGNKTVQKK